MGHLLNEAAPWGGGLLFRGDPLFYEVSAGSLPRPYSWNQE